MEPSVNNNLEINNNRMDLLYEVSRALVSGHYWEEVLLLIVGMTAERMGSKICSLMLLDEQHQELDVKATQSLSELYRGKPPILVGESVSGRAVERRCPISVKNVQQDADYKYPEIARAEGLKSLISVPMMIKDRVIGVLNCYTAEEHEFTADEIKILVGVANQVAIAVENTNLLAEKIAVVEKLETRKKVEKAKGILMERLHLSEDAAFKLLQKQSMDKRKTLKEISEAIVVAEDILK